MPSRTIVGLITSVILACSPHADAELLIVHAGEIMTRADQPTQRNMSVVIRDGVIVEIASGFLDQYHGEEAAKIDLTEQFVLPGLIDCHTHLTQTPEMFSTKRTYAEVSVTEADRALLGVAQARKTLEAGYTTVRNLGGFRGGGGEAIFALRDAINRGDVTGPRILAAGQPISVIGGHGDTHGLKPAISQTLLSPGICTGADQCAQAARSLIARGADVIKVTVTGGVSDIADSGLGQHFTDAELEAIVEASHLLNRSVAAHAHAATGIEAALRAGVDSIEHGTFSRAVTFELFLQNDAYFVTTLTAPTFLVERSRSADFQMPPIIAAKLDFAMQSLNRSTYEAYEAGVKMAVGTDVGVSPHGENANELALLVGLGIPERDVLIAATINGAELLGLDAKIGSLEAGKRADIIAVCSNPPADITTLSDVTTVLKDGRVVTQSNCQN